MAYSVERFVVVVIEVSIVCEFVTVTTIVTLRAKCTQVKTGKSALWAPKVLLSNYECHEDPCEHNVEYK